MLKNLWRKILRAPRFARRVVVLTLAPHVCPVDVWTIIYDMLGSLKNPKQLLNIYYFRIHIISKQMFEPRF